MILHNQYMIVISIVFALASIIMLVSLIKHHLSAEHPHKQFGGPTGSVQWLWALVPLAILGGISFALFDWSAIPHSAAPQTTTSPTSPTSPSSAAAVPKPNTQSAAEATTPPSAATPPAAPGYY